MNKKVLLKQIQKKKSFLCIGLDTDLRKIPPHLLIEKDPLFTFNQQIIDATFKYCVAYKLNIAFYESLGVSGWESLQKTLDYIPSDCFTIADAKCGDIGNSSIMYAKTFFETFSFNAVTVSPYMGEDSVKPFLDFKNKWIILLLLTSNLGSSDFQISRTENKEFFFERVLKKSMKWASSEKMMYVVGATKLEYIKQIRAIAPDHFLLVPGVGAQGGNLSEVIKCGVNKYGGLLINISRSIIYAGTDKNFTKTVHKSVEKVHKEMSYHL